MSAVEIMVVSNFNFAIKFFPKMSF